MRIALLADVHANLHALQAALRAIDAERVDAYVVAGDLVGYGPLPDECVALIADMGATCVAGNHDLMALDRLSDERCIALARRSLSWTRATMQPATRAFLAALPPRAQLDGGVVVAHGSLEDPTEYISTPAQAVTQLERMTTEHPGSGLLVLGHTHRAWVCSRSGGELLPGPEGSFRLPPQPGTVLVNPGAIGQSRERTVRSRFAVLDLERATVSFHAVRYDVAACRRALRDRGLPPRSYHLRRSALSTVRRAVSRALPGRPGGGSPQPGV